LWLNSNGHRIKVSVCETDRDQNKSIISNLFDTANIYSHGLSEEILGQALQGRRNDVLVATKARMVMREGPNEGGTSRYHLIRECEASLRRLKTDYIDLYQLHEWDGETPLEESLDALDTLVRSGKVRYIGCSNYSGWHLMKALGVSERRGFNRFVSQQIHYSLQARDAENELVPISIDRGSRDSCLESSGRRSLDRQISQRGAGAGRPSTPQQLG
jgi:aryl-alcohol dehydrogenase-like predicted oxidoreductase